MKDSGKVKIHGKEYSTVAYRVSQFREIHGLDLTLTTEIISRDEDCVVMKATIAKDGRVLATGHAEEKRAASQINRTSALENAETSAIGRALAALGMGGTEFASADEVANAIGQQKERITPVSGSLAALPSADQENAKTAAAEIVDAWINGDEEGARVLFYDQNYDNEFMLGVWELMGTHSKVRNGIKKLNDAKKQPKQTTAEQA